MFKWIIMKELLEFKALNKYFALWQPLLTSLPITSLHRSENRHDSTGTALIQSSRMLFMLAARASKWLLWCLQWSLGAALKKCPIQWANLLSFSVHHPCKPSCASHISHNFLATSSAWTNYKLSTSRVVSSDGTEHLPALPFQMLTTPTGMLVTVDLSNCKLEACFEHFDLFSESSLCGGVCRGCYITFLVWLLAEFCWQSVFPCRYKHDFCDKAKLSGFSNVVTQIKRHFKDYSIHLTGQIDTFLFHCQLNDLMLFTLYSLKWFKLIKMIIRL